METGEWISLFDAVRELRRHLKDELGSVDPAPWIDRPPEWHETAENILAHKWVARTSLTLRRAFLAGQLDSYLVRDGLCLSIPGWAWENAVASAKAFDFGWLPIDPFLRHDLHECQDWRCFVHRSEFAAWLQKDGITDIGDLPLLTDAFDLGEKPHSITYSEPSEKPFVELTEALTWAAFGIAVSHKVFGFAEHLRFGPFQSSKWQDDLGKAMLQLAERASGGHIRVRGRYVGNYSDHEAALRADTSYLDENKLRDFACFDSLHGGLKRGKGLLWECQSLEGALNGRADGWRDVEVSRDDLLKYFPVRIDDNQARMTALPASLPGIGAVMGLEEAICWTAHGKPSNDLLMWETAAGELLFRDRSGTVFELGEDREVPEEVARDRGRRRAAMLAIWNAMRDGNLSAYVAPADAQPFTVPRIYWNGVNTECLDLVYRGMSDADAGRGCPILLSRQAFDAWRATVSLAESAASGVSEDQPKRYTDFERQEWMRAQPMMSADNAHKIYKKDQRFCGTKLPEFRNEWKEVKGTKRGRTPNKKSEDK